MALIPSKFKIAVTGAGGFIGRNLLSRLKKEGFKTHVLVRNRRINIDGSELYLGDLVEGSGLKEFLSGVDVVVNLVGGFYPPFKNQLETNVVALDNLCQAAATQKIKKMVHISATAVYGFLKKGIFPKEDGALLADTTYGLAKKLAEQVAEYHHRMSGISFVILRPPNVYGSGSDHGVVANFIDSVKKTGGVVIYGDGKQERDFLYVDDMVDAIVKSINFNCDYETFNVGFGKSYTINTLVSEMEKVLDRKIKKKYLPEESFRTRVLIEDITKAKRILGWKPKIDLPEGLKKIINKA